MGAVKEKKSFINKNLIILKIVIFFTFVGKYIFSLKY